MVENTDSKDNTFEALDFLIKVLKEHEQNLDKSINQLTTVSEQTGKFANSLNGKMEDIEEKINTMQKEVTNLVGTFSNAPTKFLPTSVKEQAPKSEVTPAGSSTVAQGGSSMILRCKEWKDFLVSAMNAQQLFFSYKEAEKVFEVDALRGNLLITYEGAPDLSMILKKSLSLKSRHT